MTQSNLNLELLIKLMRLTESNQENEALAALRKANEHLKRMKWDWERLLRGKVTVAADPFAGVPDVPLRSTTSYAPTPYPPSPPPQPGPQQSTYSNPSPRYSSYGTRKAKPKKGYVDLGNAI